MAIPDPATAKQALRRLIRDHASAAIPAGTSAAIVRRILDHLGSGGFTGPLSLYSPRRDEPDLLDLLRHHPAADFLFPRVVGEVIVLHQIEDPADLSPGTFGILEPPAGAPVVEPEQVSVFLCPGVAFDPGGRRLGRGGGYYDRLLARRSADSLVIGVCCERQLVAEVPAEDHDARMDLIVTERRTLHSS